MKHKPPKNPIRSDLVETIHFIRSEYKVERIRRGPRGRTEVRELANRIKTAADALITELAVQGVLQ